MENIKQSEVGEGSILWATKIGEPNSNEQLITEDHNQIENARKWALENGFDRIRVSKVDMSTKPNFNIGIVKKDSGIPIKNNEMENIDTKIKADITFLLTLQKHKDEKTPNGGWDINLFKSSFVNKIKALSRMGQQKSINAILNYFETTNKDLGLSPVFTSNHGIWKYRDFVPFSEKENKNSISNNIDFLKVSDFNFKNEPRKKEWLDGINENIKLLNGYIERFYSKEYDNSSKLYNAEGNALKILRNIHASIDFLWASYIGVKKWTLLVDDIQVKFDNAHEFGMKSIYKTVSEPSNIEPILKESKSEVIIHENTSTQKELWEMTFNEFLSKVQLSDNSSFGENEVLVSVIGNDYVEEVSRIKNSNNEDVDDEFNRLQLEKFHQQEVLTALRNGKPVPVEVVNFYSTPKSILFQNYGSTTIGIEFPNYSFTLDNRSEYESKPVDELIDLKKRLYSNMDIESPMSEDEKLLNRIINEKFSKLNSEIKSKEPIKEKKNPTHEYKDGVWSEKKTDVEDKSIMIHQIQSALTNSNFWLHPESREAKIIDKAEKDGWVIRLSHTQAQWSVKAEKELLNRGTTKSRQDIEQFQLKYLKKLDESDYRFHNNYSRLDECKEIIRINNLLTTSDKIEVVELFKNYEYFFKVNDSILIDWRLTKFKDEYDLYELKTDIYTVYESRFNDFINGQNDVVNPQSKKEEVISFTNTEDGSVYTVEQDSKGVWTVFSESPNWERRNEYEYGLASKEDAILMAKLESGNKKEVDPEGAFMRNELKQEKLSPTYEEEIINPNTDDEFYDAIFSQISTHDSWYGDVIKERYIKRQIAQLVRNGRDEAPSEEVDAIFEVYKQRFIKDNPSFEEDKNQIYYTTAPVSYDGFGTHTIESTDWYAGDKQFRKVSIPIKAKDWQLNRYSSGGNIAFHSEEDFNKFKNDLFKHKSKPIVSKVDLSLPKTAYNFVFDRITKKIAPNLLALLESAEYVSDVYGKSNQSEDSGYMPFVIEGLDKDSHGRYILSFAHYYVQNGDLMCDKSMEVRLDVKQGTIEALSFKQDGIFDNSVKDVYIEKDGKLHVNTTQKNNQNSFLNKWTNNLVQQKHVVNFKELPTPTIEENEEEIIISNEPVKQIVSGVEMLLPLTDENNLSKQLIKLTGDGFNAVDFSDDMGSNPSPCKVLVHNKTGRRFLVPCPEQIFKGISAPYENQFKLNKAIEEYLDSKDEFYIFSDEEKAFLYLYEGYGGLEKEGATGRGLLWEYYTPQLLIKKMWGLANKYGFNNGKVLEPSVGVGRFLDYVENTPVTTYEINPYSARICKILHPTSIVNLKSFEEHFYMGNMYNPKFEKDFSLVIGNPPYGEFVGKRSVAESKRLKVGVKKFEHYFILRGLDCLKSGGLLIYVSTANLFTKGYDPIKEKISEHAELIDAYLLPNKTFAKTQINTSIIVLKKR